VKHTLWKIAHYAMQDNTDCTSISRGANVT
jgi:hypothetical protein